MGSRDGLSTPHRAAGTDSRGDRSSVGFVAEASGPDLRRHQDLATGAGCSGGQSIISKHEIGAEFAWAIGSTKLDPAGRHGIGRGCWV